MLGNVGYRNFPTAFSPAALFAASEPGVWYDPSDVANTLWRYNLFTFTDQFDNAAWVKDGSTVSANSSVAPDGTTTADTLTETATTGFHSIYQLLSTSLPTGNFSFSIYVKASGRSKFRLQQNSVVAYSVLFDIVALTATTVAGGASGTISDAGNGWYRCTMNYTTTSDFAPLLILYLQNDAGAISYAGNGTSGVFIWGAQLQTGSTATTYQPITTVAAGTIARYPLATLYQDIAGTTPVTAPNQPVGLMLDKSQGLVLGANINTAAVPFTVFRDAVTNTISPTLITAVNGKCYQALITVTANTGTISASLRIAGNGSFAGSQAIQGGFIGVYTTTFVATGSGALTINGDASGVNLTVSSVSVKELPGNHATQSTSGSRPTYGIVPATGRRNLLVNTIFAGTVSGSPGTNPTNWSGGVFAGTRTLTLINESLRLQTVSGENFCGQTITVAANSVYIMSIDAAVTTGSLIQEHIRFTNIPAGASIVYLLNGTVVSGGTVLSAGNQTIACRLTVGATAGTAVARFGCGFDGAARSCDIIFSNPQAELSSTRTAYQRVVTAFEVTEANVASLSYISFDGIDDFMVTPTIDPSAGVTPGPELVTNGTFAINVNGWTFEATATNTSTPGFLSGTTGPSTNLLAHQIVTTVVGRTYTCVILTGGASTAVYVSPSIPGGSTLGSTGFATNGTRTLTFVATSTTTYLSVMSVGAVSNAVLDNISLREIVADKAQVFAGVRKLSDAAIGVIVELGTGSGNGLLYLTGPRAASGDYGFFSKGTVGVDAQTANLFSSPVTNILTGIGDIAEPVSTIRVNGVQRATSASTQGTGNYLAYPLYIGRRGGTTLPFNGQMYGLITRFGANLTTTAISRTESWMNNKTGAF